MKYLLVFLGGGLGSVLRYIIGYWSLGIHALFPVGTLIANLVAALVLATCFHLSIKEKLDGLWLLLCVGFCGGLSTFSAFSLETFQLFQAGESLWAWVNIVLSIALSLAMFSIIMILIK